MSVHFANAVLEKYGYYVNNGTLFSIVQDRSHILRPNSPDMGIEKTAAQMRKGVLELCVLRVLDSGEAYASDIAKALRDADLLVVEGTLYPLLTRMKNAGALEYRWEESSSGPPRKYYQLTTTGAQMLLELNLEWKRFVSSVNVLAPETKSKNQI